MNIYSTLKEQDAQTDVYRLSGYQQYLSMIEERRRFNREELSYQERFVYDTSGMTPALSARLPLSKAREDYRSSYAAVLPRALEAGYYLVDLQPEFLMPDGTSQTLHAHKLFQITDASIYLQQGGKSALAWVNDVKTNAPVEGAVLELADNPSFTDAASAKTNKDGVALAEYDKLGEGYYRVSSGSDVIFAGAMGRAGIRRRNTIKRRLPTAIIPCFTPTAQSICPTIP